jgi:hypothetical protein
MKSISRRFSKATQQESGSLRQFVVTPAAGKRLIAKALAVHPAVRAALRSATVVIVAGTTNGYVAEEILALLEDQAGFSRWRFFRGIILPPGRPTTEQGRLPDESEFPGDVIIRKGKWIRGKTLFDVVDELREGDIIIKGANALDVANKRAAVLIGHPKAGIIGAALQAVAGRRVRLILAVGLEKRVPGNLDELAARLNAPGAHGPRLLPEPGEVFTEIEAIAMLAGATAEIAAAGGIGGAEGSVWLAVRGTPTQIEKAAKLIRSVAAEPAFKF